MAHGRVRLLAAILVVVLLVAPAAHPEKRVAFVIGNAVCACLAELISLRHDAFNPDRRVLHVSRLKGDCHSREHTASLQKTTRPTPQSSRSQSLI
jgi:hypothetical protein